MLLPILGAETSQLVYLMVPLAVATVLSRTALLGFHAQYLTAPESRLRTATSISVTALATATLLCFLVVVIVKVLNPHSEHSATAIACWTAVLTITNGIYLMAVAVATREQRMDVYSRARLVFGITNITITSAVVFLIPFQAGLILAAAMNPLLATLLILSRTKNRILNFLWQDRAFITDRDHRTYLATSVRPAGGVLLAEVGFQFQAFITPFLGNYQELWAVVVRLSGGFGTLAQQLIAPPCEAKIAESIRAGDQSSTKQWYRKIISIGLILGVCGAGAQAGAIMIALSSTSTGSADSAVDPWALILVSVFCFVWMPSAMCAKLPLMKGLSRHYLAWSTIRLALLLPLLLLRDGALLVGIVAVISATALLLMWISRLPASSEMSR